MRSMRWRLLSILALVPRQLHRAGGDLALSPNDALGNPHVFLNESTLLVREHLARIAQVPDRGPRPLLLRILHEVYRRLYLRPHAPREVLARLLPEEVFGSRQF